MMKTFEQLAAEGYNAYRKTVSKEGATEEEMASLWLPEWSKVGPTNREGWIRATQQIVANYAVVH